MSSRQQALIPAALLAVIAALASLQAPAGGWAVATATAEELPDDIATGEEFAIRFQMRQHGVRLADWGPVQLSFTHRISQRRVAASASPDPATLEYTALVSLPDPGIWEWTVGDGFVQPMGSLAVTAAPADRSKSRAAAAAMATVPPDAAPAQAGRELFMSQGCVVCHRHRAVEDVRARTLGEFASFDAAPDLSDYRVVPEYLKIWLADPRAINPDAAMPDLDLDDAEIEALIGFLAAE